MTLRKNNSGVILPINSITSFSLIGKIAKQKKNHGLNLPINPINLFSLIGKTTLRKNKFTYKPYQLIQSYR